MKREDIKKRLISQTENLIPDMKDSILDRLNEVEILAYHKPEKSKTQKRFMARKALTAVGLSLILVISGVLGFVLFNDQIVPENDSYIYISINPKVELVSNSENQVKSARGLNKDGILLLVGENLIGMDTNQACRRVVMLANRMGYLANGNKVSISVVSSNTKNETKIESSIKELFIDEAEINLELASESTDKDVVKLAREKGTSVNMIILAKTAMEIDPDLTIDNALLLSPSRLLELVSDYDEGLLNNITDYVINCYEDNEELNSINEKVKAKEEEIEAFATSIDELLSEFDIEKFELYKTENELEIDELDSDAEDYLEKARAFIEEYSEIKLAEFNEELEQLKEERNIIVNDLKNEIKSVINEEISFKDEEIDKIEENSNKTE